LNAHFQKTLREANGKTLGISLLLQARVKIEGVLVDVAQIASVKALAEQLLRRGQRLDAVVWNAGIGGWTGLNWFRAIWTMSTDPVQAATWPTYQYSDKGAVVEQKGGAIKGSGTAEEEPVLGQVFAANVFGHYMLTHWLRPLFDSSSRIVWIGSISAMPDFFSQEDMQCLRSPDAYESSKRLTDLLVLTSELPSTAPYMRSFLPNASADAETRPKMYIAHPGILATSMSNLNIIMSYMMLLSFYLVRWLGSPWHTVTAYKAAVSTCFCALAPEPQLADLEVRDGKGKWGSAISAGGDERVVRTEVQGWGFCGEVGKVPAGSVSGSKGRKRGMKETGKEAREEFEVLGRSVWAEMEELRQVWEARVGKVDVRDSEDL